MRQQHFTNASVAVEVDALLLPPPAAALRAAGVAEEQGQLLLELSSPDGGKSWRVEQAVSVGPAGQAAACDAEQPADEALPGGAAAAVPQPVRRTLRVIVEQPQLWWPHDFGQQPLYLLQVTYTPSQQVSAAATGSSSSATSPAAEATSPAAETSRAAAEGSSPSSNAPDVGSGSSGSGGSSGGSGGSSGGSSGSTLSRRIGLRRVELVTEALPGGSGETFFFRVNGQPVYARGAGWWGQMAAAGWLGGGGNGWACMEGNGCGAWADLGLVRVPPDTLAFAIRCTKQHISAALVLPSQAPTWCPPTCLRAK